MILTRYKSLVEPNYPEMKFSREDLLWGFNTLVACGWGSGNDGTGDKMMVPFSELPVHRRESAQKVAAPPSVLFIFVWSHHATGNQPRLHLSCQRVRDLFFSH